MGLSDRTHHTGCPVCDATLLGYTDADMVEHFVDKHNEQASEIMQLLGVGHKHREVCDNCGREYVTYQAGCPYCRHGGEPFK